MTPDDLERHQAGDILNIAELVARLEVALMPVPAPSAVICGRCRSTKSQDYTYCYKCYESAKHLFGYSVDVVPISMSVHTERLHDHLRQYKDGREPCVRYRHATALGGLLAMFLNNHARCLGDPWDVVSIVPSLRARSGNHPLAELVNRVRGLDKQHEQLLVADPSLRGVGRSAHPGRYRPAPAAEIAGRRVLLIDDTFTTGASLQSAAFALQAAGATSVTPLVFGRHLNPSWAETRQILPDLRQQTWAWDRCALCDPVHLGPPQLL